ncbi:LytR family transcriptional regulator [Mycobacterium tuberculosis]
MLFLGVVFLLLGWQALGSSPNSEDDSSAISTMTTTTAAPTSTSVSPRRRPGRGARLQHLRHRLAPPRGRPIGSRRPWFHGHRRWESIVTRRRGDHGVLHRSRRRRATADAVGRTLGAAVELRLPELSDQPPGVIVVGDRLTLDSKPG